ncbi:MAG: hybrid sensor histidine kinase/response regulator [Dolichospermum sp. DET50]|nr:hybrid sensor histidine kinase/response regulator [Dolichospermum sp. DET66]MBS3031266.1 hybrid sensor histidine kinase/response regulator [Dolichospermum sp. DET67]MBS3036476.1 hybrid sensor histidine kinase/response regulator [Dolichospermum sp. DET50]QSX68525.1 MAG: hybrid sensor histidine kinase/response regulator [Dolichospermum sp. DET69]
MLPKILIIDDEPNNFDVIETLLDNQGYELSYVNNAQQALELLDYFQPDVILLDVMMPEMNGIEFCQKFKSNPHWKHISIIMVTALASKEDLSQCLLAGADDFITKPINGLELRLRTRSMLRIKQQYDALQEILYLREDLSNMIVHDLRNPLAAIIMSAEILQVAEYSQERQEKKTSQIITNVRKLQSMIDSLLIMAKLDSGKITLQRTDTNIFDICSAAIADIELTITKKNLELITKLPQSGITASLDPHLFRRVIDNLLSNAIKFTPGKSQISFVADYTSSGKFIIQIADSGSGVKQELREVIFAKYEVGNLITGAYQIGLGLAFCKMVVEAHGGCITVEENYPTGAIFIVEI